jgi:YggT family protein
MASGSNWAPFTAGTSGLSTTANGTAGPPVKPKGAGFPPLFLERISGYSSLRRIGMLTMVSNPFLWLISQLIWLYIYILIASAVLSWLVAFNVINTRNDFVRNLAHFLYMVTEPALRPIRSVLPDLGGIDISPVILMIGLIFLEKLIYWLYFQMIT